MSSIKTRDKKPRYRKVTIDGEITEAEKMVLKEMQEFVGGYIEYAPAHLRQGHKNIICNEEGIRLQLPRNKAYPEFLGNVIIER